MAIFDIWMEWFKHIWVSILPCRLPSIFCSRENIGLQMLFEELQVGCLVHGHLWYVNGKILAILSLNRALSFEDVIWRIPWRLLSAWPSLVSECNDLSIWHNWLMPTIKALPERTYGLEDVVWRNSRWLFSAWPFLINVINGMILAILSLHVAWRIPSSFCLRQYIGWKMLFEEYQDVCLVLRTDWNDFYLFWVSMLYDASQ